MPKVVFISPDQTRLELDVPIGTSLMLAAVANGVAGISGDCGGGLACATCHVLVDEEFLPKIPPLMSSEDQMLDFTAMGRRPNSRLSCQLVMQDGLDGLTVQIADPQ